MPPRRKCHASPELEVEVANMNRLVELLIEGTNTRRETFKLPKHDGSSDVELYLLQFNATMHANEWINGAALLLHKCSLEGSATACGRGDTLEFNFQGTRARFSITPRQACGRLGQLKYEPNTSLRVLGSEVERLVAIGYPDTGIDTINTFAIDVFTRALNHNALQRRLLVMQIESVADAVRADQEYCQVGNSMRKGKEQNGFY